MIEAKENVDLVTVRRQADLDASRLSARQAVETSPAPPSPETATLVVESQPVPSDAPPAPGREGTSAVLLVALSAALALAAAVVWWKGGGRR